MGYKLFFLLFVLYWLVACERESAVVGLSAIDIPKRQYDSEQLTLGEKIYQTNCASCHGGQAQGDANWRKKDADGHYPAPPLNGSGHAWHHSTAVLSDVIINGSAPGKGKMPAWKDKLSEDEIYAVIDWFQSSWPQPLYEAWFEIQQRGR
jgi:mono/diheme cytochrome c family protein